jgi:hypothetical protein
LRIQLNDVLPVVWRRLLVPGSANLAQLSDMLLTAMGWNGSHLHSFRIGHKTYSVPDDEDDYDEEEGEEPIDETKVTVAQVLREERRFTYEYDFGDSWEHEVAVEDVTTVTDRLKFAVCLDGQNACPPDDIGGPPGYKRFLHDFDQSLEGIGGPFDAAAFEVAAVNAALQTLR